MKPLRVFISINKKAGHGGNRYLCDDLGDGYVIWDDAFNKEATLIAIEYSRKTLDDY